MNKIKELISWIAVVGICVHVCELGFMSRELECQLNGNSIYKNNKIGEYALYEDLKESQWLIYIKKGKNKTRIA